MTRCASRPRTPACGHCVSPRPPPPQACQRARSTPSLARAKRLALRWLRTRGIDFISSAREEDFGPVLAVLPFGDEADAVRLANDTDYGLLPALWTEKACRL